MKTHTAILNGVTRTMTVPSWFVALRKERGIFAHYSRAKLSRLLLERSRGSDLTVGQCLGIRAIYQADDPAPGKHTQHFNNKEQRKSYQKVNPIIRKLHLGAVIGV